MAPWLYVLLPNGSVRILPRILIFGNIIGREDIPRKFLSRSVNQSLA